MGLIHGIPITLYEKRVVGKDGFGGEKYEEVATQVENVIIAPVSAEAAVEELNLYGKHAVYQLGIPKGDQHEWDNAIVEVFGKKYHAYGAITEGIEEMIPLAWHKIVKVERYE